MLTVTEYRLRSTLSREDEKRLMDLFAEKAKGPGELAHYIRMDGGGGYVVADSDDVTGLYERILEFGEFMEFTITPVLNVDDAVGPIMKVLAG